ncbi:MAG: MerR family DNA-binding transcriptional regulator, partial [Candidatus Limnocylindria bacterium]
MNDTGTPRYSLTELADLAGVTPRTVRYYINQGLL